MMSKVTHTQHPPSFSPPGRLDSRRLKRLVSSVPSLESLERRELMTLIPATSFALAGDYLFHHDSTIDESDNLIVAGSFGGSVDFDPDPSGTASASSVPFNYTDGYVARYTSGGALDWVGTVVGEQGSDNVHAVAADAEGNLYVTGNYLGRTTFFGQSVRNASIRTNFTAKLDPDGLLLWLRDDMGGVGIDVDSANQALYIAGTSGDDAVVMRLNTDDGMTAWSVATSDATGLDQALFVTLDETGIPYVAGEFRGDITLGTTTLSAASVTSKGKTTSGKDVFVARLDASSGAFVWARSIGGAGDEIVRGMEVADGAIYLTGGFGKDPASGSKTYPAGFGSTTLTSKGSYDAFMVRADLNGNFAWAKSFGGTGSDVAFGPAIVGVGRLVITGSFLGTVDFNPSPSSSFSLTAAGGKFGGSDAFVAEFDVSGNFLDAWRTGGNGNDVGNAVIVDAAGSYYAVGEVAATGPGPEIFVQKFQPAVALLKVNVVAPRLRTSPSLTLDQVAPVMRKAQQHWGRLGFSTSRLDHLTVRVGNLPNRQLASISGSTITLDDDAAGWGWSLRRRRPAARRIDLLSVLVHEVGHGIGLSHGPQGIMAETLSPGVRRLRTPRR